MTKTAQNRDSYHHGNLPDVLTHEAAKLLAEKGIEGFSMREVARRAGVAVAAPAHHFGNAKGLLTAIATVGFTKLAARQTAALEQTEDPVDRVTALCRIYVEMAVNYPGYAAVMFRWDLLDTNDAAYAKTSSETLNLLISAMAEAAPDGAKPQDIRDAAKTLWAAMHGFVNLSLTGDAEADARISFAVKTVIAGMHANRG